MGAGRYRYGNLSAYLTLLSAPDAATTQDLAIRIDRLETLRTHQGPDHMAILRNRVTATIARILTSDRTMMAWATNSELLVATSGASIPNTDHLEQQIIANLQDWNAAAHRLDRAWAGVSVGGPVSLQGTRFRCAALAIGSAADQGLPWDSRILAELRPASGH